MLNEPLTFLEKWQRSNLFYRTMSFVCLYATLSSVSQLEYRCWCFAVGARLVDFEATSGGEVGEPYHCQRARVCLEEGSGTGRNAALRARAGGEAGGGRRRVGRQGRMLGGVLSPVLPVLEGHVAGYLMAKGRTLAAADERPEGKRAELEFGSRRML